MSYRDEYREVESNTWWTLPRAFGVFVAVLVLFYGLGFLATGGNLAIYKFWAPKQANAERQVFENTQGYVQGKTEYLTRLEYQYKVADPDRKPALRTLIIDEASTVDNSKLPVDLQVFIRSLKESM